MLNDLSNVALVAALLITIGALVLWRVSGLRVNRAVVISALLALVAFQLLYWSSGSYSVARQDASVMHRLLLVASLLLAANALLQLAVWALVEFVVKPRRLHIPQFLLDVTVWLLLLALGLLLVSQVFNVDLTGLLISSTVVSAVLALSLQQTLGSLFAGITLQIESPYAVDDWVAIDGEEGKVVRQNWRTLTLRKRTGEHVILPNGNVAQKTIINHTRPNPLVAHDVFVPVGYHHPPGEVIAVLREALAGIAGIETTPAPQIMSFEYTNNAIRYRIRFWLRDWRLQHELQGAVVQRAWYALQRAQIEIAIPIHEVNLHRIKANHHEQRESRRRRQIAAALQPVPLFSELQPDQITRIADRARLQRHTAGERLVEQGEAGDSLFVVKSGQVQVYVANDAGRQAPVAERGAGDFFGEMSLLTGEPRSASVVATMETEVVVIDKAAFSEVLTADPTILDALLAALDRRRSALQTHLHDVNGQATATTHERLAFLQRIGNFLGVMTVGTRRPAA